MLRFFKSHCTIAQQSIKPNETKFEKWLKVTCFSMSRSFSGSSYYLDKDINWLMNDTLCGNHSKTRAERTQNITCPHQTQAHKNRPAMKTFYLYQCCGSPVWGGRPETTTFSCTVLSNVLAKVLRRTVNVRTSVNSVRVVAITLTHCFSTKTDNSAATCWRAFSGAWVKWPPAQQAGHSGGFSLPQRWLVDVSHTFSCRALWFRHNFFAIVTFITSAFFYTSHHNNHISVWPWCR